MVTIDGRLTVLALPEQQKLEDGSLPHVVVKKDIELKLVRTDGHRARPVVLETGFTTPYFSMMQIRKQVIVIVTDDWHVLCFDSDLHLNWETILPKVDHMDKVLYVKSLGVLITSHSIQKTDEGLIIVGGSFMHKTHQTKELPTQHIREDGNVTEEIKIVSEEVETLTHFSTFALSASSGTIRWHHLPGDFGEQTHNTKDHASEHHWKLGLRKGRKHTGESSWKHYSKQMNQYMPFLWVNNQYTKFTLGRFNKDLKTFPGDGIIGVSDYDDHIKGSPALSAKHIVGYAYGGHRPHSELEHVANPNAIVIRGPHGIEVLSLLSGQPITRLEVTETKDILMDIDGDGEMEQLVWDLGHGHTVCYLDIWRTYPVKEKLEQLSLCISQRLIWQRSWALEEDIFKKIPPIIIKSLAKKSGVFRHLLGKHLISEDEYDIITFGAVGRISSFDLWGNIHWQTQTSCKWSDLSIKLRRKSVESVPEDLEKEFMLSFTPTIMLMPLHVAAGKDIAAVVGWNAVSLVDLADGTILAEHSIPSPPTGSLAYGDFDNDGINDIILTCKKGFIGFTLKKKVNYEYTIMYASAVLLAILFVTWVLTQPLDLPPEKTDFTS
ncbi:hypothetical protein C0Q70_19403 [Pomacea canaliculata]|uniref:FG-GAP repeat-containing protein n=2 Tax=Pomacea canaliculata TaxID=400727 RepID=A0A2T7NJ81_POMCA|nr:hypothetical protein C0Q70_19403 [Pomacea canaliculata]